MIELIQLITESITTRKLRSFLTVLGIVIGISLLIILITLSSGMQEAIKESMTTLGTDIITIEPGSGIISGPGIFVETSIKFSKKDLNAVKKAKGVEQVAEMLFKTARVTYKDKTKYTYVTGIPVGETKEIFKESYVDIKYGRYFSKGDKYKAILGALLYTDEGIFGEKINLKDKIQILGKEFEVVGILKSLGNNIDDNSVFIPIDTAKELFNTDEISIMMARIKKGYKAEEVANNIEEELRKERNVEKGKEDFKVSTAEDIVKSFSSIMNIVKIIVAGIAGISILVGGILIMNTMFTSILERTREIGIMKAIGAKRWQLLFIFITESAFYGLIGGILGIVIGSAISKIIGYFVANAIGKGIFKVVISPKLLIITLIFAIFVGIISGLLPALRASKLEATEALRYE